MLRFVYFCCYICRSTIVRVVIQHQYSVFLLNSGCIHSLPHSQYQLSLSSVHLPEKASWEHFQGVIILSPANISVHTDSPLYCFVNFIIYLTQELWAQTLNSYILIIVIIYEEGRMHINKVKIIHISYW